MPNLVVVVMVLALGAISPSSGYASDKEAANAAKDDAKAASKDDKGAGRTMRSNCRLFRPTRRSTRSMQLGGRTLKYDATVGSLPVFDEKGKQIASVMSPLTRSRARGAR